MTKDFYGYVPAMPKRDKIQMNVKVAQEERSLLERAWKGRCPTESDFLRSAILAWLKENNPELIDQVMQIRYMMREAARAGWRERWERQRAANLQETASIAAEDERRMIEDAKAKSTTGEPAVGSGGEGLAAAKPKGPKSPPRSRSPKRKQGPSSAVKP